MASPGYGESSPRGQPHSGNDPATPTRRPRRNTLQRQVTESAPAKGVGIGVNMNRGLNPRAADFGQSAQGGDYRSPHNTPTKQAPSAASARGITLSTMPTVTEVETPPASAVGATFNFSSADKMDAQDGGHGTPGSEGSGEQAGKYAGTPADAGTRGGTPSSMTQLTGNLGSSQVSNAGSTSAAANGRAIIKIADERNYHKTMSPPPNAVPNFMQHIPNALETNIYRQQTIPYLQSATYVISCMPDLHYLREMLSLEILPNFWLAVTSLDFTGFHWFSGTSKDRPSNPYLSFAATLPNLTEIKISFHTASLTASALPERERIRLENIGQLEESKTLKVLRCPDVVKFYGLNQLFNLRRLKVIKMDCQQSEMVSHYCRGVDPMRTWHELVRYIVQGYLDHVGQLVGIESQIIPPPASAAGGSNARTSNAGGSTAGGSTASG